MQKEPGYGIINISISGLFPYQEGEKRWKKDGTTKTAF